MSERTPIDLVVAVVTWNSAADLPALVDSLPAGLAGVDRWQLVIADNASSDGTTAVAARLAPEATVLALPANGGFAAGVNAAVAAAPAHRAVLVLNADVALGPGAAAALLAAAGRPGVGIAVPRLLGPDGSVAPSLRREPTVLRALGESVLGGYRAGWVPALGEVVRRPGRYTRPGRADWASGAVWLVTRPCFAAVGGFDESFFLYSEETDFALRARDLGYGLTFVPGATAHHRGGQSSVDPSLHALLAANRVRGYRRRHGRVATLAFRGALLVGEGARAVAGRATSRAAVIELRHRPTPAARLPHPG
jgi:GT2 family glycosyltransferase